MAKLNNYLGMRFGKLQVISRAANNYRGRGMWQCLCDCGKENIVEGAALKRGHTKSCGCLVGEKLGALNRQHGLSWTPEWKIWVAMNRRCNDKGLPQYKDYGGRGISVCDRWKDFALFLKDMGAKPKGMSLDRIDVNGNYEPGNCRWACSKTQARNTRRNRYVTLGEKTQALSAWIEELGLKECTIKARIYRFGWTIEQALTVPVRGYA
jgi:hypothetical protein